MSLVIILSALLGVSEVLALMFPSPSGFGGIVAGVVKFLKSMGVKDPSGS